MILPGISGLFSKGKIFKAKTEIRATKKRTVKVLLCICSLPVGEGLQFNSRVWASLIQWNTPAVTVVGGMGVTRADPRVGRRIIITFLDSSVNGSQFLL
jgi:hypothetical protein